MIHLFKYGVKTAIIGADEFLLKCPVCEVDTWADVRITGTYYHIYFIPIMPLDKYATVYCTKCGVKRPDVPFNERLIKDFNQVKKQYKYPWYTYIGVVLLSLLILTFIAAAIIPDF